MVKSKTPGRPRSKEGRVTLNITLPPYVAEWLKATGNASEAVAALVRSEISYREGQQMSKREIWNGIKPPANR